jgi:hypothetical protein
MPTREPTRKALSGSVDDFAEDALKISSELLKII